MDGEHFTFDIPRNLQNIDLKPGMLLHFIVFKGATKMTEYMQPTVVERSRIPCGGISALYSFPVNAYIASVALKSDLSASILNQYFFVSKHAWPPSYTHKKQSPTG